ncbi:MAG: hypothetical protein QOD75_228 [Blastocatellia bacterium]|jgi:hypothetical protein|nr:hypothetical protein [Blastocatellia bacterium]
MTRDEESGEPLDAVGQFENSFVSDFRQVDLFSGRLPPALSRIEEGRAVARL